MHRWDFGWWSFGHAGREWAPVARRAPRFIPSSGPATYTQNVSQLPAPQAEPKDRAGFMLIPEIGASMLMYVATSTPTARPVKRAQREPESTTTMNIRAAEMRTSAASAGPTPQRPGRVTTKL